MTSQVRLTLCKKATLWDIRRVHLNHEAIVPRATIEARSRDVTLKAFDGLVNAHKRIKEFLSMPRPRFEKDEPLEMHKLLVPPYSPHSSLVMKSNVI